MSNDLRSVLRAAFPPRPITQRVLTDLQGAWEAYDDSALFETAVRDRTWDSLDKHVLERHASAIIYLGDRAFAQLLPAYLLYLVDNEGYGEVQYTVAAVLTRKTNPLQLRTFSRRVRGLSATQRAAVEQVLQSQVRGHREEMMTAALESYWRDDNASI